MMLSIIISYLVGVGVGVILAEALRFARFN